MNRICSWHEGNEKYLTSFDQKVLQKKPLMRG
jgi:hypothetical protein